MSRPYTNEEYRKILADTFADVLEEKGLEWKKEWQGTGGTAPQNGITGKNYRGTNAFYLSLVSMMRGYKDPRWFTSVQIFDANERYHPGEKWKLTKGSKAVYVEYWYPFDTKEKKALTWDEYKEELKKEDRKPEEFALRTRYTPVFNGSVIDGLPPIVMETQNKDILPTEMVRTLAGNMDVPVYFDGGDRAYYSPKNDMVHVPTMNSFENDYAFASTVLHELAHATGHPRRLNRKQDNIFGSSEYAYEELVAEICSCFMSASSGIEQTKEHIDNHKAYVSGWIAAIRDKPEALARAIKDAQAASSYMDWKAELITFEEYKEVSGKNYQNPKKSKDMER